MALVSLQTEPSAMAESFRATLTSILFSGENGRYPRVIVISSAAPREGKTTLATNLAVAVAAIHQRVLLIDADIRRPSIHRFFDLENDMGLVDLLRSPVPIQEPLNGHARKTDILNLSVLTTGRPTSGDPTLFHSSRLTEIVSLVRAEYDMVVIDTPPMLNMSDARVIARHADGVVLVARANKTSRDSIKDAYRRFLSDGTRLLGTVLNDWNPKKSRRYGYYSYYDKYKQYYGDSKSKTG
jgi:capsular exopolysaccharide synthesis family protein